MGSNFNTFNNPDDSKMSSQQQKSGGFGDNSILDKNSSDGFSKNMRPVNLNETGPIGKLGSFNKEVKKKSSGGSNDITEQISDNYEDDDFDIGESLAKDDKKNDFFSGKNQIKDKISEKESSKASGLGFEDDYQNDFF